MNDTVSGMAAVASRVRRVATPHDWRQASALLHDHLDWMRAAGGFDLRDEQPAIAIELGDLPREYRARGAALFVAYDSKVPAGIVAIRRHADASAELKRMYVRPFARGRGFADELVGVALGAAATDGCNSVWLETLPGVMDAAIAVYRRHGFSESVDRAPLLSIPGVIVMERAVQGPIV